ncbi:unnamed protein product [Phytophthora fragariaefolia]|uniref:Unnamed protein product n=1 Tax=Phytophthora fragariaefolia TaxID=1490495 RepID=A0A9W6XHL4_9STRA|nr:unnamed protein product [Phytophthora fragariaefolia]
MPKSNAKTKKAPRATEATPKDASPSAEESSPKETTVVLISPAVGGPEIAAGERSHLGGKRIPREEEFTD